MKKILLLVIGIVILAVSISAQSVEGMYPIKFQFDLEEESVDYSLEELREISYFTLESINVFFFEEMGFVPFEVLEEDSLFASVFIIKHRIKEELGVENWIISFSPNRITFEEEPFVGILTREINGDTPESAIQSLIAYGVTTLMGIEQ